MLSRSNQGNQRERQGKVFEAVDLCPRLPRAVCLGDPGRDPRGHTITVAFMAWASSRASCRARAGDDAAEADFFPVKRLPKMAFDHLKVVETYMPLKLVLSGQLRTSLETVLIHIWHSVRTHIAVLISPIWDRLLQGCV